MPKEQDMEKLLKTLMESDLDENELNKVLKEKGYSEEGAEVLKGTIRLLGSQKDSLPKDTLELIAKFTGLEAKAPKEVKKQENGDEEKPEETPPVAAKVEEKPEEVQKSDPKVEILMKQNAEIKKALENEVTLRKTKEFIEKAGTDYDQFSTPENFGPILKEISENLEKESFEKLCEVLKGVNAQLKESELFKTRGTGLTLVGDSEDKIQKLAEKRATDKKISVAKAYTQVITDTKEGRELYTKYLDEKEAK